MKYYERWHGGTMAHFVKCLYCSERFDRDKEEAIAVNGRRYAHKLCFERHESSKTKEQKDLENLQDYIKKLFNQTYINARVNKQIKDMVDQYNYSYSGMLRSLIYFYEVKGNSLEKANGGIGIVPYIYQDAYNYYYELFMAQERNKDKSIKDYISPSIEIVIKSPKRKPRLSNKFNFLDQEG